MEVADIKKQKRYQWIKGDKFGDVVEVSETQKDIKWLYFTDGSRINPSLVKEFLMEIEHDNQVLNIKKQNQKPAVAASAEEAGLVPRTGPTQDQTPTVTTNTSSPVVTQPEVKEPTVMGKMIENMSKKNVVNVPVEINVNIPTPAIYAMLSEGMESEDLNEEIMSVALAQIEINKLQEYIKEQIINFLNTYYG